MTDEPKSSTKYVMIEPASSTEENEIELIELIRTLLLAWKTVVSVTVLCTGVAVAYALVAPDVFKAEALLAPVQEEQSGSTSALNQFGGLAAMAGMSIPNDSNVVQVLATLNSGRFLQAFIERNKLLSVLFEDIWDSENQTWIVESVEDQPSMQNAIGYFKNILSVAEDKKTGLITLSIQWKEPEIAAKWANDLVDQLNEQLRNRAITDSKKRIGYLEQELAKTTLQDMRTVLYKLLESEKQKAMLANVNEDFALKVIDPAVAPENREKPKRKLIVALGGVCGGFLGIFVVFFAQYLQKLKSLNSQPQTNS
jgi:uncharacterized protein involved in exopolysaccharide biosynthesis